MFDSKSKSKGNKIALLIHGYPEPIYKENPIYQYFIKNNYTVIAPYLFTPEFKLTAEDSKKYIEKGLNGAKPDVIVGVSMGGLIAPIIAQDYPSSKLVLIATGPYLGTNVPVLNTILLKTNRTLLEGIINMLKHIPTWLYRMAYLKENNVQKSNVSKKEIEEHIKQNWACVIGIPTRKDIEVIDYLTSTDNTEILKSIKNKTIIYSGKEDRMMPTNLSLELSKLINGSKLIISESRLHYNVFTESEFDSLDLFLSD